MKRCNSCGQDRPLHEFLRRTGKKAPSGSRRGVCKECRKTAAGSRKSGAEGAGADSARGKQGYELAAAPILPTRLAPFVPPPATSVSSTALESDNNAGSTEIRHQPQPPLSRQKKQRLSEDEGPKLTLSGRVWLRGKSDKGRRWQQEIEPELAMLLVREKAAVIVNRHVIRRLYTNRQFKQYILQRDHYTCQFCGGYGDTIDHLLPRSKGGHTTPVNCVCACNACNQSKADRDVSEFLLQR